MPVFSTGLEDAEVRQIDIRLAFSFKAVADRPAHVGLAGTKPDFADGHVIEFDGIVSLDCKAVSGAAPGFQDRCAIDLCRWW